MLGVDTFPVLGIEVLGNTLLDYILFTVVFFVLMTLMNFFRNRIIQKIQNLARRTKTIADDFVIAQLSLLGWPLYIIVSLYISMRFITVPAPIRTGVDYATLIVVLYYLGKSVHELIDLGTNKLVELKKKMDGEVNHTIIFFFGKFLKVVFWVIVVILILSNLGYEVNALVAGLGIGGIAIAFALQNILGDLFSSLSIYFDKPFQIEDFIIIGDDAGTVKNIGIKSTRLQTLQGEELVIPNSELTNTRIHNFKRLERRRIVFNLGVTYETSSKKLEKIPEIVKNIFDKIKKADLDRVHFKRFDDFCLNYEIVYYVDSGEYMEYMDIQQEVNLAIKKVFDKNKIDFAYPTQTVFVKK